MTDLTLRYTVPGLVMLLLLLSPACQDGPDENLLAVEAFVEEKVQERLATYRTILDQQCREAILQEAGAIADSILLAEARLRRDSVNKPPRPAKPEKPELKKLEDSLSLDPLFRDSLSKQ